jgi:hypothetical protein
MENSSHHPLLSSLQTQALLAMSLHVPFGAVTVAFSSDLSTELSADRFNSLGTLGSLGRSA